MLDLDADKTEKINKDRMAKIECCLQQLSEYFDAVHIVGSYIDPDDHRTTQMLHNGIGNAYARIHMLEEARGVVEFGSDDDDD